MAGFASSRPTRSPRFTSTASTCGSTRVPPPVCPAPSTRRRSTTRIPPSSSAGATTSTASPGAATGITSSKPPRSLRQSRDMAVVDDIGSVGAAFAIARAELEEQLLAPPAARSYPPRRAREEPDCSLRTPFQRDRDRIVHCKAFRRLKHKTQVFVAPMGDHYRTRLTHTLEVTTISRTVARALRLNEDLVEAIGMGHDLGHPPFGHIGEEILDECLRERFGTGFRHYEHSLRVVERLERDGAGLNLTEQVRDGIARHSSRAPA